jgi:hypothetical protein
LIQARRYGREAYAGGVQRLTSEDLQGLSTGEAIVRVNSRAQDFNIAVLQYEKSDGTENKESIISLSRQRYSVPVAKTALLMRQRCRKLLIRMQKRASVTSTISSLMSRTLYLSVPLPKDTYTIEGSGTARTYNYYITERTTFSH